MLVLTNVFPKRRVYALIGFCDIHHFEDINLKLRSDGKKLFLHTKLRSMHIHHHTYMHKHTYVLYISTVLLFVNTIAEIVHSRVHGWGGQCNKNLGMKRNLLLSSMKFRSLCLLYKQNAGNAFVIVWRIGDEKTLMEQTQGGKWY